MKYTKDQVARIEEVNQAAKNFVNLLIKCPEYLSRNLPDQLIVPPIKDVLCVEVADLVSKLLTDHDYIVFYPNHVETADPAVEYITDVYETEDEMESHIRKELEKNIQ